MQRRGHSDVDLVAAVRRAASEASSVPLASGLRHVSSEADLRPRAPGGRCGSQSSSRIPVAGLTLQQQRQRVQDAAVQRYVAQLEKDAREEAKFREHWNRSLSGSADEEKVQQLRRRQLAEQNQQKVWEQIEANKVRRSESRREFVEAASAHAFPVFTETSLDPAELEAQRRRQKETWRQQLDQQMVTNLTLRNIQLRRCKDQAIQRHKDTVASVARERGLERERLASQGREMMSSWEREIKLKSIKRAIMNGQNVQEALEEASGSRLKTRGSS